MADAIKVKSLVKSFNGFKAVNKISFNVVKGELFGLLGPNGAGKTTTINILSTLLKPTSGKAYVSGFDVSKHTDEVRKNIGIVFQEPALDGKLTGWENLNFHALLYGMKMNERKQRISEVLELVEMTDKAKLIIDKYSGGMKRRLEIARGLMHRPNVLFLDEPTLGLDTQTRRAIWDYIKKLNKKLQMTIILTTHYMEEADSLCDRIAIMDHGKIVAIDTPMNLKNLLGGDVVNLEIGDENKKEFLLELKETGWIKSIRRIGGAISLNLEQAERKIPDILEIAGRHNIKVESVTLHKPSLEDVFLYFTGRGIREDDNNDNKSRLVPHAHMSGR